MSIAKFRRKTVEVEAVHFGGSTTQMLCLTEWIRGGEYVHPQVATRDMTRFEFDTTTSRWVVRPGDWVVRLPDGRFEVEPGLDFEARYDLITPAAPLGLPTMEQVMTAAVATYPYPRMEQALAEHDRQVLIDYEARRKADPVVIENIDGQTASVWIGKIRREAVTEAADWLEGFLAGGGHESPYEGAGRDIIARLREHAVEVGRG